MPRDNDIFSRIEQAILPPKKGTYHSQDEPRITIKRNGRIVLNRPAANLLASKGNYAMMLLNSEFREFYIKSSEKSQKAHKVAYGRGGVPGLITGRSALEAMGFDLSVNHPPLEVTVKEVEQPPSSGKVEYKPGDIILIAEIPQGYFTTDPKPEAKPEAKAKRRGK